LWFSQLEVLFPECLLEALKVEHLAQDAVGFVVPSENRGILPVVLASVVLVHEIVPVWVVHCKEDGVSSLNLPCLMVNMRGVDWTRELGCCRVLLVVLKHVILDGSCEFFRHDSLRMTSTVLSKKEFT